MDQDIYEIGVRLGNLEGKLRSLENYVYSSEASCIRQLDMLDDKIVSSNNTSSNHDLKEIYDLIHQLTELIGGLRKRLKAVEARVEEVDKRLDEKIDVSKENDDLRDKEVEDLSNHLEEVIGKYNSNFKLIQDKHIDFKSRIEKLENEINKK